MAAERQLVVDGARLSIELGEQGLFYGTSPDERGLLIAGKTREDVIEKAHDAIDELRAVKRAALQGLLG